MHSKVIKSRIIKIPKDNMEEICINHLFCIYCNHYMHTIDECLVKKFDEQEYENKIKKSNIPEKYWKSHDPVKSFLMNNSIKGYKNRLYWTNRQIEMIK